MSVLSAQSIIKLCMDKDKPLITPFVKRSVYCGRSYGLSGASYDVRLDRGLWLLPWYGRLASTIERFQMPDNIAAFVKDKSSNARRFIATQATFLDPGWCGYLTLELTLHRPCPIYLESGTPIAQIVFVYLDEPTEQPYGKFGNKYQNQPPCPVKAIDEK